MASHKNHCLGKRYCLNCGTDITSIRNSIKFCGQKCSNKSSSASQIGRVFSNEHRKKISDKVKGRTISEKQRLKISNALKGRRKFKTFSDLKNSNEIRDYRYACRFNFKLGAYPDKFNFSLIKKYGWYSPSNKKNNLNGVSRDHMFSIKDGFLAKVDPEIMSHPANCELILMKDNQVKNRKSSITLQELKNRMNSW